jgi:hypothetical protein
MLGDAFSWRYDMVLIQTQMNQNPLQKDTNLTKSQSKRETQIYNI